MAKSDVPKTAVRRACVGSGQRRSRHQSELPAGDSPGFRTTQNACQEIGVSRIHATARQDCRKNHRPGVTDMKKRFVGLAVLLFGLALLPALPQAAADDKDDQGWVQLFNGKDLTGWKVYPQPNPNEIQEVIKKEEGGKVIAFHGKLKKT